MSSNRIFNYLNDEQFGSAEVLDQLSQDVGTQFSDDLVFDENLEKDPQFIELQRNLWCQIEKSSNSLDNEWMSGFDENQEEDPQSIELQLSEQFLSQVLTKLNELPRYIIQINVDLSRSSELRQIQQLFANGSGVWDDFKRSYKITSRMSTNKNTHKLTIIPTSSHGSDFSLAGYIVKAKNIRPEDISFYKVSNDEIIHFEKVDLEKKQKLTYVDIEKESNLYKYHTLEIKLKFSDLNKAYAVKDILRCSIGFFLEQFKDLKCIALNNVIDKIFITGAGNDGVTPDSLNTFFPLKRISDKMTEQAEKYDTEITSMVLSIKPFNEFSNERSLGKRLTTTASNNTTANKKQRIDASSPSERILNNVSLREGLNSFFKSKSLPQEMNPLKEILTKYTAK